jgi:hypothetical protein
LNEDSGGIQLEADAEPDPVGDWARIGLTSANASVAKKPKVLMDQIRPESSTTIKPDLAKIAQPGQFSWTESDGERGKFFRRTKRKSGAGHDEARA